MSEQNEPADNPLATVSAPPKPLATRQRRILGVLIEKARTTPDAYPLSLNALITGCNQKSNRNPLMSLTVEQVEDELITMRELGVVAEVHSGGRVAKYRHYGYDYLGVKGIEAGIMTEFLLRGEQTAGDLRSRAGRFEPIADVHALQAILQTLMERKLVVALTPPGRGQLFTHNLYFPEELEQIRATAKTSADSGQPESGRRSTTTSPRPTSGEFEALKQELADLRMLVEKLSDRLERSES